MADLAVTDSHALIWAATGQLKRLGGRARRFYERVEQGHAALYVPTIVLVEFGEALQAGDISLGVPFADWVDVLLASGHYHPVDLTPEIVVRAQELFEIPERGDRLIAATALVLDVPLITRDPEIVGVAGVDHLW